ncbi:hypothetical protein ACFL5Z_12575 [Planctomycetota bacterium]
MYTIFGILVCGFIIIVIFNFIARMVRFLRNIQMAYREGVREGMRPRSYVFSWAIRREKESRSSGLLKPSEHLFSAIIWSLVTYWRDAAKVKLPSQSEGPQIYPLEQFSSDAGLFELGCYVYFRLDVWLYQNKPRLRRVIAVSFTQQFISLFSTALEMDVSKLFEERTAKYEGLLKTGTGLKECHSYLSYLISRTEGGKIPATCDCANWSLRLDGLDNFLIHSELLNFEKTMIPALIKSIQNYCTLAEHSMQESEWVAQEEQSQPVAK